MNWLDVPNPYNKHLLSLGEDYIQENMSSNLVCALLVLKGE